MKKCSAIIIFFIYTAFLAGCKQNENLLTNTNDKVPSEYVTIPRSPIDSKIIIKIIEEISDSGRSDKLYCYTENTYSPAGSKIISSVSQVKNIIIIDYKELQISDNGASISTPASTNINLGLLQNGTYTLDININNKEIIGLLTVTDGSFDLTIQPNNLITVQQETLLRIPGNIMWGLAESIQQIQYQSFLDSLVILGAKPHNLKSGDYYYFEVDPQGGINLPSSPGMPYGKYFLYKYQGGDMIISSLIKRYAKKYLDSIYIQLSNGSGGNYYSTIFKDAQ
jgi:hypothetical protein